MSDTPSSHSHLAPWPAAQAPARGGPRVPALSPRDAHRPSPLAAPDPRAPTRASVPTPAPRLSILHALPCTRVCPTRRHPMCSQAHVNTDVCIQVDRDARAHAHTPTHGHTRGHTHTRTHTRCPAEVPHAAPRHPPFPLGCVRSPSQGVGGARSAQGRCSFGTDSLGALAPPGTSG